MKEYHEINNSWELVEKESKKLKSYLSNDGVGDFDNFDSDYQVNYPTWFEKEFLKFDKK